MTIAQYLLLSSVLFCIGIYGVLAVKWRNGSNVHRINPQCSKYKLGSFLRTNRQYCGEVFALFVIAIAAAEVGVGLAIVLLIFRNKKNVDLSEIDQMKG